MKALSQLQSNLHVTGSPMRNSRSNRAIALTYHNMASAMLSASIALVMAMTASQSFAQMQIPNPLLQPQKIKSSAELPPPPPAPVSADPSMSMRPIPFDGMGGTSSGPGRNPAGDTIRELRDRLSSFHVSAILGNQAVLRRSVMSLASGMPNGGVNAGSNSMSSAPSQSGMPAARSETMLISDGEPVEFLGERVTLVPRIKANRVFLYYQQTAKQASRSEADAIVFFGEVESPSAALPLPPVLEKVDSSYRQSISVESKPRTTSNGSTTPFPAPAVPLQ